MCVCCSIKIFLYILCCKTLCRTLERFWKISSAIRFRYATISRRISSHMCCELQLISCTEKYFDPCVKVLARGRCYFVVAMSKGRQGMWTIEMSERKSMLHITPCNIFVTLMSSLCHVRLFEKFWILCASFEFSSENRRKTQCTIFSSD